MLPHLLRPVTAAAAMVLLIGCLRRAPTNYELDKRAGQPTPPAEPRYESDERRRQRRPPFDEPLNTTSTIAPAPLMPVRTAPVIRRVWVADQALPDGSWLQGTWWYLEVEPSKWLYEVDPGSAPFAEPPPAPVDEQRRKHRGKRSDAHSAQDYRTDGASTGQPAAPGPGPALEPTPGAANDGALP